MFLGVSTTRQRHQIFRFCLCFPFMLRFLIKMKSKIFYLLGKETENSITLNLICKRIKYKFLDLQTSLWLLNYGYCGFYLTFRYIWQICVCECKRWRISVGRCFTLMRAFWCVWRVFDRIFIQYIENASSFVKRVVIISHSSRILQKRHTSLPLQVSLQIEQTKKFSFIWHELIWTWTQKFSKTHKLKKYYHDQNTNKVKVNVTWNIFYEQKRNFFLSYDNEQIKIPFITH